MIRESALGNGSMLVYLKAGEISEIYAGGYTSPSFVGVNPDFGDVYEHTESSRIKQTTTFRHSIFSRVYHNFTGGDRVTKTIEDIRIADVISPNEDIFVRYCENIRPFTLKFNIPPYVRKSLYKGYRIGRRSCDALCLVIPKGIPFYKSEATVKETRMLIIADGDAKLASDGCSVDIYTGSSRVIFVSGDGEKCIRNAIKALDDGSCFEERSKIAEDSEAFWKETLSHTDNDIDEEALALLVTHQSREGGVIASHGEPIIRAESVRDTVRAFLKFGLADRARKALEFFCKRFSKDKAFYQVYGSFEGQREEYFSNSSLGCANLMAAMLDYAEHTGDAGFIKENFAMMKSAMYAQLDEISLGMMPFSGVESEISDEILGVGSQLHGSLEATVSAACSILRFVKFCNQHSFKLQNDNGSAERRAKAMLDGLNEYFIRGDHVSLNAPEREASVKKPRFVFGDCDMCRRNLSYVYYGELERDGRGVYVCPSCYKTQVEDELLLPREKCFLPQATAILLSEKTVRDFLGEERTRKLLSVALEERRENKFVRSLSSDAIFLELAREYSLKDYKEFLEKSLIEDAVNNNYPRVMMGARSSGRLDTKTIASFLLHK